MTEAHSVVFEREMSFLQQSKFSLHVFCIFVMMLFIPAIYFRYYCYSETVYCKSTTFFVERGMRRNGQIEMGWQVFVLNTHWFTCHLHHYADQSRVNYSTVVFLLPHTWYCKRHEVWTFQLCCESTCCPWYNIFPLGVIIYRSPVCVNGAIDEQLLCVWKIVLWYLLTFHDFRAMISHW